MHEDTGWTHAKAGLHWTRGRYVVSTLSVGDWHGYAIYKDREHLRDVLSWDEVEKVTDRRRLVP